VTQFFLILKPMKREELAKKLARKTGLSNSEARNEVDELVHNILHKLRKGQQVKVPGVGKLVGNKKPR
jgi:nucleoid DNA-binding protein